MEYDLYIQSGVNNSYPREVMMYDPSSGDEFPDWLTEVLTVFKVDENGNNKYFTSNNKGDNITQYYINTGGSIIVKGDDLIIGSSDGKGHTTMVGSINKEKFELLYIKKLSIINKVIKWIKEAYYSLVQ